MNKQKLKTLQNITRNVQLGKHTCQCDGCNEKAINSHLLQRKGILNHIAENGHVVEIRPTDFFKWDSNLPPLEFKLVGITQAISLPVFCDKHDTELFKKIEQNTIDLDDLESQLLLSYRVICAEIVKKEQNIEINKRIKNAHTLDYPDFLLDLETKGYILGLRDLKVYKNLVEAELARPTSKFHFAHYTYPKIGVAASATFSYEVDAATKEGVQKSVEGKVWDGVFIHLIPQETTLEIVIGYHEDHSNPELITYVESWKELDDIALKLLMTDLFSARIEGWAMSPSLYRTLTKQTKDQFINYWGASASNYDILQRPGFSVFG